MVVPLQRKSGKRRSNAIYELNDWRRKHDMIVTNGFSNTSRSETTAPNCSLEQYVNEQYIWPLKGYETVLYSGLEDAYVHMVGKDVIPDTDYELASHVRLAAGQKLPRRGLLQKEYPVWRTMLLRHTWPEIWTSIPMYNAIIMATSTVIPAASIIAGRTSMAVPDTAHRK